MPISGLDTTSLIQAMLAAEKAPLTTITNKRTTLQAQQKAWETLRTQLTTLATATQALATGGSAAARLASSSNASVLAATASSGAIAGTYLVQVNHLATATRATSTASIGTAITSADLDTNLSALGLPGSVTAGNVGIVVDGTIVTAAIGDPASTTLRQATDAMASAIQAQVQATDAAATVTAQITGNRLQFVVSGSTGSHTVSFGVAGDTSNAGAIFGLDGISGASLTDTTPITGRQALGVVRTISTLDAAGLTGLTSTKTGSLTINGATITYDTTVDSLSSIVSRINGSAAGVTASLDRANDKLVLTSKSGGASAISISESAGSTLAAALNLTPGTTNAQVLGSQASVTVDGTTYLGNSNSFSTAIDGVRLALQSEGTSTVTVSPDATSMTTAIQAVVDDYNKLADTLDSLTANPVGGTRGDLAGNSSVKDMGMAFRSILTGMVASSPVFKSLADIGVTTGKYGASAASTKRLQFDATKLASALETNPSAVSDVLTGAMGSLTASIKTWTGYKGLIDSAETSITSQLSDLSKQQDTVNERVGDAPGRARGQVRHHGIASWPSSRPRPVPSPTRSLSRTRAADSRDPPRKTLRASPTNAQDGPSKGRPLPTSHPLPRRGTGARRAPSDTGPHGAGRDCRAQEVIGCRSARDEHRPAAGTRGGHETPRWPSVANLRMHDVHSHRTWPPISERGSSGAARGPTSYGRSTTATPRPARRRCTDCVTSSIARGSGRSSGTATPSTRSGTPRTPTPHAAGDWVAVYPEVVAGNPWGAPHVARWALYFPGVLAGDREYDPSEAVFTWQREYLEGVPVLQTPTVDLDIYRDLDLPRAGALTFANKGRSDLLHVTGAAAPITFDLRLDPKALAAALNRAEVLYTTDAHTGMTQLARLCGCPVVIVPTGERLEPAGCREQYLAQAAAFPAQLATFVAITQGAAVPA